MKKESQSSIRFTRRAFFVSALQLSGLVLLGGRLAWLQIAEGRKYRMLSDKNRINIKILAPARGQIVDRFGVPLAVNEQNFRVMIVSEQTDSLERSLRTLGKIMDIDQGTIDKVLKNARKTPKFAPLLVKENLSWEQVAKIEVNLPDLPGVFIDVGEVRSYPFGMATAHVIGYIGVPSESELEDDPLFTVPGIKIGKAGVEKTFEKVLRGKAGAADVEVNVVGREVRELSRKPGVPGNRLNLTIDAELQRFAQNRLAMEKSASAIVMDAVTGAVYALASYPAFDPNVFSRGISTMVWEEILANPANPMTNKAIAGQYPPASTFKMITAIAGMESGAITPERRVYCPGHYEFGNGKFHCWKKGGHGTVNVTEALAVSCDTFFYQVSTEIGVDKIMEIARRMGLGAKLDFELSDERAGLLPSRAWKQAQFGESWQPGETIVASIGQGYTLATPMQLAVMVSRLVNGGKAVKPWLVFPDEAAGQKPKATGWDNVDVSPEHLAIVKVGMDMVINDQRGTAFSSRILEPGYSMGGKTGTAQVRRITKQQRAAGVKNEDLPWNMRHHALFVGYAPVDNPRYTCAVVVEHGVGGSSAAAPIAKDLLLEVQKRSPAAATIK